ncbi:hypothetical protein CQZ99_23820 [Pseudomonas poae]|uniref:Dermonecrotic toxin N-terminal domain-containing protein n=2 Tax=Pseudomonas poae TaxID=200451 RepID=A0A2S9EAZ0_9PSED|nr:hypothetical protein CQZ97_26540 [Pseudomonas poae]PRC12087.1 hypothetical protein CQZ99_23820 [Pseudomonas poae]
MAEAVMWPGKNSAPQVQVKTFAVDGIQAKDIIFIQRAPPVTDGPNIVLYIPGNEGGAFQSFKTVEEMNTWLKTLANDPKQLEAFSQHFSADGLPAKTARVIDAMTRFKNNDINAVVGAYANETGDIFGRLDKAPSTPPALVNGLTSLKEERTSPDGRVLYSGTRPDGQKVLYEYDAYGNFLGEDKNKNFYFVKSGLNNYQPLVPMSANAFKNTVANEATKNVGGNDIRGLYEELLTHLEHPFSGIGDALEVLGINKNTADTVERYLDNPFTALLLDLNTNNRIGALFGTDKETMDTDLRKAGDVAQGFVPYYGQARTLSSLLAKAIRNEPVSDQEKRDLADALGLKPNSVARKNLPASKPTSTPHENLVNKKNLVESKPQEQNQVTSEEHEPSTPQPPPTLRSETAEPPANRFRPSQSRDISSHAVAEGEQLIAGVKPNAKGIYQVTGANGEDRWFIRLHKDDATSQVYEIKSNFKLNDGYVQAIDPLTRKPEMVVHATADGVWEPIDKKGGINWPWKSKSSNTSEFDPSTYDYPAQGEASSSKATEKIDARLKNDAKQFHKTAKTKERPVLREMPTTTSANEMINGVYEKSNGMIVGEDHSQSSGLRVLMDNVQSLKDNKVTTLYSEGFEHSLQPDLDKFFETGEFSPALRNNLKLIDRAHKGHGPYTNRRLLETMRENGIRVKAIDVPSVEPKTTRLKNMNYYASNVIERDQALNPGEKWVARVGSDHVFSHDGDPPIRGISELTGATGVSVDDAPAGKGTSVVQSRDRTMLFIDMERQG